MTTEEFGGLVRTLLAFGGGYFVSQGVIDQTTMLSIVGALVTLFTFGWSYLNKKKVAAKIAAVTTPSA